MRRLLQDDENPVDVISKIDDFISDRNNPDSLMETIGKLMKNLDAAERVIDTIEDEPYKKEMLGYVAMARVNVANIVDALDSMLEV